MRLFAATYYPLRPRLGGRGVAAGEAAEGDAFGQVAAALVDELKHRRQLARAVEARNRLVVPVEHLAPRVRPQASRRVRSAGVERQRVVGRLRDRPQRIHVALELRVAARGAVAVVAL